MSAFYNVVFINPVYYVYSDYGLLCTIDKSKLGSVAEKILGEVIGVLDQGKNYKLRKKMLPDVSLLLVRPPCNISH